MLKAKPKAEVTVWSQEVKIGKQNSQLKILEGMPSSSNKN